MSRMVVVGLVLSLVTLLGCGGGTSGPKTVSVSGVIKIDGQPAEGVEVNFVSENFSGFGKTGADGSYRLVQGAVPGQNKITVSKFVGEGISNDPASGMDAAQFAAAAAAQGAARGGVPQGEQIPALYSDPNKSKLTYMVPDGGTDSANFDLSTK